MNRLLHLEVYLPTLCAVDSCRELFINTNDIVGVFPWDTGVEESLGRNTGYMLLVYSYYSHGKRNIEKYYITKDVFQKIVWSIV